MKARELRIGNILKGDNQIYTFDGNNNKHLVNDLRPLYYTTGYYSILYKDAEPIPLTDYWMIKFGFIKWKNIYVKQHNTFAGDILIYKTNKNNWTLSFGHAPSYFNKGIKISAIIKGNIKYVHQLQNLYFDITDKELIIKED